jgi:hypothetical protein
MEFASLEGAAAVGSFPERGGEDFCEQAGRAVKNERGMKTRKNRYKTGAPQ